MQVHHRPNHAWMALLPALQIIGDRHRFSDRLGSRRELPLIHLDSYLRISQDITKPIRALAARGGDDKFAIAL